MTTTGSAFAVTLVFAESRYTTLLVLLQPEPAV
jgi:hypothetical protein